MIPHRTPEYLVPGRPMTSDISSGSGPSLACASQPVPARRSIGGGAAAQEAVSTLAAAHLTRYGLQIEGRSVGLPSESGRLDVTAAVALLRLDYRVPGKSVISRAQPGLSQEAGGAQLARRAATRDRDSRGTWVMPYFIYINASPLMTRKAANNRPLHFSTCLIT